MASYIVRAEGTRSVGRVSGTEGRYQCVFFDYEQASETYAEQVENCPACGRRWAPRICFPDSPTVLRSVTVYDSGPRGLPSGTKPYNVPHSQMHPLLGSTTQ